MAAAYSMDLRERVITDSDAGLSSKELAKRYHVSRAWVDALKQRRRESGSIAPRKQTKFRRRVLEGQEDRLRALVTAQPDATLAELRDRLRTSVALATIWRELNQLDLTEPRRDHLEGDVASQPGVAASIDLSHSSDAKKGLDAIRTEAVSGLEGHGAGPTASRT
jgi:transposase